LRYFFDEYDLDPVRRELRRGGALVPIEPQVFDLLIYLVRNRERVVSKDDLITHVWNGRIVSESALFTRINMARSAVGDDGEAQRLIKTFPRKGLRFVGAVREEQTPSELSGAPAGGEKVVPALAPPDRPSIAVLPFDNVSGHSDHGYFCDGVSEDIITELSRFSELFVIARNSSFQYKGRTVDVRQVGRELGVRYVLEGSIRRDGDRVRISAQLVDAVTGVHRWAERYDRQLEDVFAVQDEVARTIATILAAHVTKAEIERTLNKPPEVWQAYDYYLQAADVHARFLSSFNASDLYEVRRLLEQSVASDPKYARAWARLSWYHFAIWNNPLDSDHLNAEMLERSRQMARKAVELDPNLPDAQAVLGHVICRCGEHDAAISAFERAMSFNPNFTDWRFAEVLVLSGEPDRAIAVARRHMRLDPFYVPLAPAWLGLAQYILKVYAEALPPLLECVTRAPNLRGGHLWLAAAYAQLGRIEEARSQATEALRIDPKWTIQRSGARLFPFKRREDAEHFFDGLRKAGVPD
jgi:adenylate cyclase